MSNTKIYTAQELREMADKEKFKCSFVTRTLNGGIILDCTRDVRAMLRQEAEMRERAEKLIRDNEEHKDSFPVTSDWLNQCIEYILRGDTGKERS